jgi:Cof subfamily protein (haloacid dehalogenase superfamily)
MDNSSIRLLIIDVDGTLIGESLSISPRVHDTLTEVIRRGVQISLCTGRPMLSAQRFIDDLQLPGYHIFDAGATIANPTTGDVLYSGGLSKSVILDLLLAAEQAELYFEIYTGSDYFVEVITDHTRLHMEVMGYPPQVAKLREIIESTPVSKAEMLALNDDEQIRIQRLLDSFADRIDWGWATAPGTSARFVNILAKGISKGEAVLKLAAHVAIPHEQRMGVGDGYNDEPLLQNCGIAVAMGGAPESVKQIATWVTKSAEEDGLALAVERFILANGHKD